MITLRKNTTNRVVVPSGDINIVRGEQFILGLTTPTGASYYVRATNASVRSDFYLLEFTETSVVADIDPTTGVVNLPFEGEATLAIYRADAYTVDQSALRLVCKERVRLCH
jgi:hypothetical protein